MRNIVILCLFIYAYAFFLKQRRIQQRQVLQSHPSNKVPTSWKLVSAPLKEQARQWFIRRAILKGINWNELTEYYKLPCNFEELQQFKEKIENKSMFYPDYFLQSFHGYDDGNMNWLAAQENEAASLSMCANYWKNVCVMDSERWVRNNVTSNIRKYIKKYDIFNNNPKYIESILDVGCSGGISTEYIKRGFPETENIYGLDLSPYFLSIGAFRSEKQKTYINYIHANAEHTTFNDASFELIICNFLFHEVPQNATHIIIDEMHRLLTPGGVLVVVDLDPNVLKGDEILNQFRKWAFEVTEPHIYNYYNSNMKTSMKNHGFYDVVKVKNDPINAIWMGTKPQNTWVTGVDI